MIEGDGEPVLNLIVRELAGKVVVTPTEHLLDLTALAAEDPSLLHALLENAGMAT
jgi:hypothetical protein